MDTVLDFCQFLGDFAPPHLAEDWDNVGLLVGDHDRPVPSAMTCLTITPESVAEAIEKKATLIVTHHPLPFRQLKQITADNVTGRMLLQLIEHQIAIYSPHTSFDSADRGINQRMAEGLGIIDPVPLQPIETDDNGLGAGRYGNLASAQSLLDVISVTKGFLRIEGLHYVGVAEQQVARVAVACGSAGKFLQWVIRAGCDCLVTGETNFHTCLEAKANQIALVLPGHFASERFAVEALADLLQKEFSNVHVWASIEESDPLAWA